MDRTAANNLVVPVLKLLHFVKNAVYWEFMLRCMKHFY